MNQPDSRILKFLKEHHVLTLATCNENKPWCANCFYVFMEAENCFVFTSDLETRHIQEALANTYVAGSVVLESEIPGKTQGVQFEGKIKIPDIQLSNKAKVYYLKRYPMTKLLQTNLWILEVSYIKFTDNRVVPGSKIFWKKIPV